MLLNLTPDHLDRHGTLEAYRAAKLRCSQHQRPEHVAVGPRDLLAAAGGERTARHRRQRRGDDLARA